MSADPTDPSPSQQERLDLICDRFEKEWQSGLRPSIEGYLQTVPESSSAELLRELLRIEIAYRRKLNEVVRAEDYKTKFSSFHFAIEEIFDEAFRTEDFPARSVAHDPCEITETVNHSRQISAALVPVTGYELLEEVGRGGMGIVYRARDLGLNRDVAVKVLSERIPTGSSGARRFMEEARITGQLQHPGIPAVHQSGVTESGRPFLAMKLIKGRTLDAILKSIQIPVTDGPTIEAESRFAASIPARAQLIGSFEQVCQAVAYAHAHGVVHRDLKPSNVMIGAFGEVQVMDWGLAKVYETRVESNPSSATTGLSSTQNVPLTRSPDTVTEAGSLLGTPAYMPPEQATGALDRIDARSDVFGLGGILCSILTGQPPYVGDGRESARDLAARAALDDAYNRLDASGAETGLVSLCKQCLSAERSRRPANGGWVADAVATLRLDAEKRARQAELDRERSVAVAVEEYKRRKVWLIPGFRVVVRLTGRRCYNPGLGPEPFNPTQHLPSPRSWSTSAT